MITAERGVFRTAEKLGTKDLTSRVLVFDPDGFDQPYSAELRRLEENWKAARPGKALEAAQARLEELSEFDDALTAVARTGSHPGLAPWPEHTDALSPFFKLQAGGYSALLSILPNETEIDVLTFVGGFGVFDTLADRVLKRRAS